MSPLETLAALSRGDPAAAGGLLPAARAQAFGVEAFGPAAIVELFARNPRPLSPTPAVVERGRAVSAFDADLDGAEQAWIADLHEGLIARLWRVGDGEADVAAEPALAFATDVFLDQRRPAVGVRPSDHPDLDPATAPALAQIAARAAAGADPERPVAQARALALRALSANDRAAALLCVGGPGLAPRLAAAAFRVRDGELVHARIVWDALRGPPPRRAV